jgi:hypothetical protein
VCAQLSLNLQMAFVRRRYTQIFNPQPNPQKVMPCMTSACLGSPRGLVSRCKTYER